MLILSINAGSSSLRYGIYDFASSDISVLLEATEERFISNQAESIQNTVDRVFQKIRSSSELKGRPLSAIGCRVVHGGARFTKPEIVSVDTVRAIRDLRSLAPLHNENDAAIIEVAQKAFDGIPVIATFDTAFHYTLPPIAAQYALPQELCKKYGLRRYGFHGIAHQNVSETLLACLGKQAMGSRLITCHLGNGASVCAIKDGKSIDTSMGLTPTEGLIMGSRSGDVDPGLLLYLINDCGVSPIELATILNYKSGLLGLSNLSSDVRDLEQNSDKNKDAEFALEAFAYRVSKYIGAYCAVMGGVDAIAFSGGIGENSISMRARICKKLKFLGIHLIGKENAQKPPFCISTSDSHVAVWIIHADENLQIAKHTREALFVLDN